jgi:hypothetical protein
MPKPFIFPEGWRRVLDFVTNKPGFWENSYFFQNSIVNFTLDGI